MSNPDWIKDPAADARERGIEGRLAALKTGAQGGN